MILAALTEALFLVPNGVKKRKHPKVSSSLAGNVLLIRKVRRKVRLFWADRKDTVTKNNNFCRIHNMRTGYKSLMPRWVFRGSKSRLDKHYLVFFYSLEQPSTGFYLKVAA